jgi:ATP-dependent DNA helicase RecG
MHGSVPYNPDIANAFFRASLIEAWGQGIFKMIGDCIEAKVPPPIFKYNSSEFVIEFHGETDSLLEETVEKTVEKTREKTREKILKFIGQNNKITVVELADLLGITSKGVEYQITKLKGSGIIDRIGHDKGGTWIIL